MKVNTRVHAHRGLFISRDAHKRSLHLTFTFIIVLKVNNTESYLPIFRIVIAVVHHWLFIMVLDYLVRRKQVSFLVF